MNKKSEIDTATKTPIKRDVAVTKSLLPGSYDRAGYQPSADNEGYNLVDKIVGRRLSQQKSRKGELEYKVRPLGWDERWDTSWETFENLNEYSKTSMQNRYIHKKGDGTPRRTKDQFNIIQNHFQFTKEQAACEGELDEGVAFENELYQDDDTECSKNLDEDEEWLPGCETRKKSKKIKTNLRSKPYPFKNSEMSAAEFDDICDMVVAECFKTPMYDACLEAGSMSMSFIPSSATYAHCSDNTSLPQKQSSHCSGKSNPCMNIDVDDVNETIDSTKDAQCEINSRGPQVQNLIKNTVRHFEPCSFKQLWLHKNDRSDSESETESQFDSLSRHCEDLDSASEGYLENQKSCQFAFASPYAANLFSSNLFALICAQCNEEELDDDEMTEKSDVFTSSSFSLTKPTDYGNTSIGVVSDCLWSTSRSKRLQVSPEVLDLSIPWITKPQSFLHESKTNASTVNDESWVPVRTPTSKNRKSRIPIPSFFTDEEYLKKSRCNRSRTMDATEIKMKLDKLLKSHV